MDKTAWSSKNVTSRDGGESRERRARGFAEERADDDGYAGAAGARGNEE
jgi:hypothetical protein